MNHKFLQLAALATTLVPFFGFTQLANGQPLKAVPNRQVQIEDTFWAPKLEVWRAVTIPDCFAKFEKDGAFTNFDKIREDTGGEHGGPAWYDGLVYEMIRAAADFLAATPDAALEKRLDAYIERIDAAAAKDPNGYLNTYTQMKEPGHRWGQNGGDDNLQHDVYNAGAMIEAGVHYYRATGKTQLLQTATRLANHMADLMGPPPKQNIVPGHSLGEEALVKLYQLYREEPALKSRLAVPVEEQRYLKLAEFFLENRGHHEGRKNFGSYGQDHQPVLEQQTIEGHAVRATLLCAGLCATALVDGRADYLQAAERLWDNMVQRRMYVTGGLGAVAGHEGFGADYELPNNGYLETCAAIGAGFFHENLNLATADGRYADELERVLFNSVLSGVSLAGNSYFYENPLEAGPQRQRWAWHSCPCCPPMFLKIMGALPGYLYAQKTNEIYVNQFIGSRADIALAGVKVKLQQTTRYPWDGEIHFTVSPDHAAEFGLNLRLPAWCRQPHLSVNGKSLPIESVRHYARLRRQWQPGDVVDLSLPMPVQRLKANPAITADVGRVALARGPLIYCLEGVDHGGHVKNLALPPAAALRTEFQPQLLGGVMVIRGSALARSRVAWPDQAYLPSELVPGVTNIEFTAIPYFANANRAPGEMCTWIPEDPALAVPVALPSLTSRAKASASHCWGGDTVAALNDRQEPAASDDQTIPRFTWWDHRGTKEWVQYDFELEQTVSAVEVYWWDERRSHAHCRVPQSWQLFSRVGAEWKLVPGASAGGNLMDQFNRLTFPAIRTTALRIEVQLQPEWSGGILEWRVE